MVFFIDLWFDMVQSWWPDWSSGVGDFYWGEGNIYTELINLHNFNLPDFVFAIGSVVIVVLLLVALISLFKWMFTLVWRLFKID